MSKTNIECSRSTAIRKGGYVSYTYPAARVLQLQGKLVEQASSAKKKAEGRREQKKKTKREKLPSGIPRPTLGLKPDQLLTCLPYPMVLHGSQQAAIGIGRRRATGCTIRARPV
jgi:hypothetical protein